MPKMMMMMTKMGINFLVLAVLVISSYDNRVSCDATIPNLGQSGLQLQGQVQVQQQQPGLISGLPNQQVAAGGGVGAPVANGDELKVWQSSPYYVDLFDPAVTTVPAMQREFCNKLVVSDLEFFREILREAIDRRNKFAPSVGLVWKYAAKLLARLIKNRREETQLPERMEPSPEFFRMLADLADAILAKSAEYKRDKGYNKNNIDTNELYLRVDSLFNYMQQTIAASPVAAYLKWNQFIVFKNDLTNPDHDRPVVDYAAELTAQFRSMGYESCVFVARRIVNLLRMFSKGSIPQSDKDV